MKLKARMECRVTEPVAGIHRVEVGLDTIGYVLEANGVYVALEGAVYNTACEVGQTLDLDTAVHLLLEH